MRMERTNTSPLRAIVVVTAVLWLGPAQGYYVPVSQDSHQEVFCECVPYYLCVDGVILTDGSNLIDVRSFRSRKRVTNVEVCPSRIDICCGIPPPPTENISTITTTTATTMTTTASLTFTTPLTLPPDTPCSCVSFPNCPSELLVSDGLGNTSLEFLGLSYSHSQCPDAFSLCCAIEPTTISPSTPIPTPTPTMPLCECVLAFLCSEDGYIIEDGRGLLDPRSHRMVADEAGECSNSYFVCCLPPTASHNFHTPSSSSPTTTIRTATATTTTASTSTTTTTTTPSTTTTTKEITIVPCNSTTSQDSTSTPTNPTITPSPTTTTTTEAPPVSCGIRNYDGIMARIIGFRQGESQFGEFPWVAAVVDTTPIMGIKTLKFVGGGTLIHPKVVLTAAHKLNRANSDYLVVRVGEWDTQKEQEPHPHQDIEVEKVVVHPRFDGRTLIYDMALLFLKEEAILAPHVNTLCLAENLDAVDTSACVINGWGVDTFDGGQHQRVMKSLTLPLVERNSCMKDLRTTRLGPYFRLHHTFLCAGGEEGQDACKGDGGGPLACPVMGSGARQYLLVGITAWGIGCGQDGVPGVYVNVPRLHHWITSCVRDYLNITLTTATATTTTTSAIITTTTAVAVPTAPTPFIRSRIFW